MSFEDRDHTENSKVIHKHQAVDDDESEVDENDCFYKWKDGTERKRTKPLSQVRIQPQTGLCLGMG